MIREKAEKYAENMTYREAIYNLKQAKSVPYRKATFIKVNELLNELEQEAKKGHWIIDGHHRRCSECDEYFCIKDAEENEIPSSFCPNCGADMREGLE